MAGASEAARERKRARDRERVGRLAASRTSEERERLAAADRERYASDPEYRERRKAQARKWRQQLTPEERSEVARRRYDSQRAWWRERYATDGEFRERMRAQSRDPERAAVASRRRRASRNRFLAGVRETVGCVDCGTREGRLDFDHRPGEEKAFNLADHPGLSLRSGRSWRKVLAELEKCDVRCQPCHIRRHQDAGESLAAAA